MLLCPWDSPGKNTGVGSHALLQWKNIVDPKCFMNQFNVIKIYTIFTQQQDTNSTQVPLDYKPGDTGTYPGT